MDILERTFDADDSNLYDVLGFVEEQLEKHDASMKDINIISIALEEMFVNIAHYAYEDKKGDAVISVWFEENNTVCIRLKDKGFAFNPLAKIDPDIHAKAEDRGIGGLGIYMVKKSMSECSYERTDDCNIFTMKKVLNV